jgi:tetratricopeptide (TPR) repeat protein
MVRDFARAPNLMIPDKRPIPVAELYNPRYFPILLLLLTHAGWCDDLQHCDRAQQAKDADRPDEAVALYQRCIGEGALSLRNRSVAYNSIGNIYLAKEQYAKAIENFNRSIELMPEYSLPYNNRGVAHQNEGRYRSAIADYSKSIELNPDHLNAYNNLAWIKATCPLDEIRNSDEALQLALRVNRITGWQDPGHLDTLAAAHAEAGNFADAVKYEKLAIERSVSADHGELDLRLALYLTHQPYRELRKGHLGI